MLEVNAEPSWLAALSPSAKNALAVNNDRLIAGSEQIVVNPAYDQIADEDIFKQLERILSNADLTPKLRKIEEFNRSRFGSRSQSQPWADRVDSLRKYYDHGDFDPGRFDIRANMDRRPKSLSVTAESLIKRSSSGLPYMTRKGRVLTRAIQDQSNSLGVYPCVLFTRTQEQKKTRNVWGFPISDTLEESRFFSPWLPYEKSLQFRSALLGPDAVDSAVTNLLSKRSSTEDVVAIDFEQFDATVKPEHAYAAFSKIAELFQSEFHDSLYRMFRRFVTIPIYTPEGEYRGPHGVPSGSTWTNTVDSLVQFGLSGIDETRCQIQGDDGLYLISSGTCDDLFNRFEDHGLKVNREKSDVFGGHEATFLQRYYHPKYKSRRGQGLGGVYSVYRAFSRIKYLERWYDFGRDEMEGRDFFSLRAIMILENCKNHPMFEDIVLLARNFDKAGLRFSNQGLKAYSRSIESRARAGVLHTESLDKGLENFETMRVLRTL